MPLHMFPTFLFLVEPNLQTWGVRKLTVVDGGCVAIPDVVKQSLYVDNDCGVPRATAIVPHLKERCPAVVSRCYLYLEYYVSYRSVC